MRVELHTTLPDYGSNADRGVFHLYGLGEDSVGAVGRGIHHRFRQWRRRPSILAWDLLTLAMAVEAADRSVLRASGEDGWTRTIDLSVPLRNPRTIEPQVARIEHALAFLTGDRWSIDVRGGGPGAPSPMRGRPQHRLTRDCTSVCLFSGGADSLVGALNAKSERSLVLVSHAPRGDSGYQEALWAQLGPSPPRFAANANATSPFETREISQRSRSFLFLGLGAAVASTLPSHRNGQPVTLLVPENGFMAINAPLSPRRIGSLSTRTTHPYFLGLVNEIWEALGLGVIITNPLAGLTKGEAFAECVHEDRERLLNATMSCGKWLRKHVHCGTCVPCLVRRAAFLRAGIEDRTPYFETALADTSDDVLAVRWALGRSSARNRAAVLASGPLDDIDAAIDVHNRGLQELRELLT